MRTWLALAIVIGAAVAPTVAAAQGADERPPASVAMSRPLALDDVLSALLERHPLLKAAAQEEAVAAADVLSADGGFDPALRARAVSIPYGPYPNERIDVMAEQPTALWGTRLFGGWRYGRGSFAVYDGKLETGTGGEGRVGAAIPLWRDGPIDRRRAASQKAEFGTAAAKASVEQQRLDAVRAASHRYWDWVAAGRRLQVARDMLAIAVARDAGLAVRVDRGDIPAFERAENERVIHQRRASVVAAERSFQNAQIELSLFYRGEDGSPVTAAEARLPVTFPEPQGGPSDGGAAERLALAQRPELRRFEASRAQAQVDRDLANNQRKLGIELSGALTKDFGRFGEDDKRLKPEVEVAVLVDVPLLTRVQDGRVQAAEAAMVRAGEQARFAKDRIVADVRDATSGVAMARERLAAVRREIVASEALVEAEKQRFELGEGTLLLVNLREAALAEARGREIDALADYHKAAANQRAATGTPARGGAT